MALIAILANSIRPDGHCLAGIDLSTGLWVRPITKNADAIPVEKCTVNGKLLLLRDIVAIELTRPPVVPKYQRENHYIGNWNWQVRARLRWNALAKYIDATMPVLHSYNDRVLPQVLEELPPDKWKSLQLIQPRKLSFKPHHREPNRWVATFRDSANNRYVLKVTDVEVIRRIEKGDRISEKCLMTISLTKPWTYDPKDKPAYCYKVVAAVMELS